MAARSGGGTRADGRATAEQVIEVAERLFAERGVEAVSLREVAKAATSRNTAVTHYHFGGREGLVRAIVARRAPALNRRRAELLEAARDRAAALGRPVAAEDLVRVLIVPLIEELDRGWSLRRLLGPAGRRAAPGAVGGGTGRFLDGQLP